MAPTARDESDRERAASRRLAALVADREGLDLAVRFVDRVARPEDPEVAARALARLPTGAARFLGLGDRLLLRAGSRLAPLAPRVVVPLARRRLRQLVGHLVVDARDPALARHLARARAVGVRLNLNLLGEAVLGEGEAARRAERTLDLLRREDVDHVSIKVSSLVSQTSPWDTPGTVARVGARLRPLYEAARERAPRALGNLALEECRDRHLARVPDLAVGRAGHGRPGRRAAAPALRGGPRALAPGVREPRHGGVPRPPPHARGVHRPARRARPARPRGGHRAAGLPARLGR